MKGPTLLILLCLCSCASRPPGIGLDDYDENSTADGAAYITDSFNIRRAMPSRPDWKPMEFYFKHCTEIGEGTFYSKTSYECSGPY